MPDKEAQQVTDTVGAEALVKKKKKKKRVASMSNVGDMVPLTRASVSQSSNVVEGGLHTLKMTRSRFSFV